MRAKTPVVYISGVFNSKKVATGSAEKVSDLYGAPVVVLWNPTSKLRGPDLLQTLIVNKLNMPDASNRMIVDYLRARFKASSRSVKVVAGFSVFLNGS